MGALSLFACWPPGQEKKEAERMTENILSFSEVHEHECRQPNGREILVNQFNFTAEYKEYRGLGSLGTNFNWHLVAHTYDKA